MKKASAFVRVLLVLFFFQLSVHPAFSQLRKVYADNAQQSVDFEIFKLSFISATEGYAAFNGTNGGYIGYTQDSGHTFVKKYITQSNVDFNGYSPYFGSPTPKFDIRCMKALSRDTILVTGNWSDFTPTILYSVNGGNSFKMVFYQAVPMHGTTAFEDIVFPENNNVGYGAADIELVKTTDRGASWTIIYSDPEHHHPVFFSALDNNNLYAHSAGFGGTSNTLMKTTDGATTWQYLAVPDTSDMLYASFLTPNKGWVSVANTDYTGSLYYTGNGGTSWKLMCDFPTVFAGHGRIKFINDSTGYYWGFGMDLYKTTDSGKVWERLPRDNNYYHSDGLYDLQIWNNSQFWIGGGGGFLELTTNGGGTPIPEAYFTIDTANVYLTNTVKLINQSKPSYSSTWLVNGQFVSNSFNSSYQHIPYKLRDTVSLVVSNGTRVDTTTHYVNFNPPSVCAGGNISFTSNVTGTSYQWQQDAGSGFANVSNNANISGATTANITLTAVPSGWSGYKFRCLVNGTQQSAVFLLTVNAAAVAAAGPDKAICSGTGVQIGTAAAANQTYAWSPATGLSSATSAQPTANPAIITTYTVTATTQQGCTASSSVVVSVTATPATPSISPSGTVGFCTGSNVILSSSISSGNQWFLNGTAINGATAQTYTASAAGSYTVRATAGVCPSALSAAVTVTSGQAPAAAAITQVGNLLVSSAATGNQWYRNGVPITGATSQVYSPLQTGLYTVIVTLNGCVSPASNAINFVFTAINSPVLDNKLTIGPNPVQGQLFISYTGTAASFELTIEDMAGQRVLAPRNFGGNYVLDMQRLTAGIYTVRIRNLRTGEHVQRLIVKL